MYLKSELKALSFLQWLSNLASSVNRTKENTCLHLIRIGFWSETETVSWIVEASKAPLRCSTEVLPTKTVRGVMTIGRANESGKVMRKIRSNLKAANENSRFFFLPYLQSHTHTHIYKHVLHSVRVVCLLCCLRGVAHPSFCCRQILFLAASSHTALALGWWWWCWWCCFEVDGNRAISVAECLFGQNFEMHQLRVKLAKGKHCQRYEKTKIAHLAWTRPARLRRKCRQLLKIHQKTVSDRQGCVPGGLLCSVIGSVCELPRVFDILFRFTGGEATA